MDIRCRGIRKDGRAPCRPAVPRSGAALTVQVPTAPLSGSLALIRHFGPGYLDHCHKRTEAREIIGIRRVQRQLSRDRRGSDHQIDCPAAGLPACRDHGCRHPSVRASGLRVEWDRIELVLSSLQHVQSAGPLSRLEVEILVSIGPHFMWSSGELGQGNGADGHFIGKLIGSDPASEDHDIGVQQATPHRFSGHKHLGPDRPPHPDPPGTLPRRSPGRCATSQRTRLGRRNGDAGATARVHRSCDHHGSP